MTARAGSLLSSYPRDLSVRTRLFLRARLHATPYDRIAAHLPPHGRILDLGCGHGLLALTVARIHPGSTVLGIDHDPARIAIATEAGRSQPNARFEVGDLTAPPPGSFTGIALVDVLHYLEPDAQEALLRAAAGRLEPGGTLLVREVDPGAGLASAWNRWYERVAVGIGFTATKAAALHFRSREGWLELLAGCGLDPTAERCSSPLFADVLFSGTRRPPE